jgi:hypothetical protein
VKFSGGSSDNSSREAAVAKQATTHPTAADAATSLSAVPDGGCSKLLEPALPATLVTLAGGLAEAATALQNVSSSSRASGIAETAGNTSSAAAAGSSAEAHSEVRQPASPEQQQQHRHELGQAASSAHNHDSGSEEGSDGSNHAVPAGLMTPAAALPRDESNPDVPAGLMTPAAALPRVHTPGKAAAAVAAEMATPMIANSASAVLQISEAWREESSHAQNR